MDKDHLKYIKDRIQGHEEYIDKDALWNSLGIEKKKRRILPIWWYGSFILALVLMVLGALMWPNNDIDLKENIANTSSTSVQHSKNNSVKHALNDNDNSLTTQVISSDTPTKTGDVTNSPVINSNILNEPHTAPTNTNNVIISEQQYSNSNTTSDLNLLNNQPLLATALTPQNEEHDNTPINLPLDNILNSADDAQKEVRNTIISPDQTVLVPGLQPNLLMNEPAIVQIDETIKLPPSKVSTATPKWQWNIGAAIGLYNIQSSVSNIENEPLLAYRKDHERRLESLSFSTGISYSFTPQIYVTAGIRYQRLTQRLRFQSSSFRKVIESQPVGINVPLLEDTTYIEYGDVEGVAEDVTYYTKYNEHHLISIPITVGYQQSFGRLKWFLEGGPIVNLSHRFNGQTLNRVNAIASETNEYKSAIGLGLTVGAGLQYPILDNMSLYIKPRYVWWVNPITVSDTPISQRLHSASLEVGTVFSF